MLWNAKKTKRPLQSSGDNMQSNGPEIQIPIFFLRAHYTMNSVVKDLIRTFLSVSKLDYLDVLFRENDPYKSEIA